ncbi:MAG TPA: VWA domain-containing protein [Blastocatellia bacterium]|nr:VWA domain-containing protein [Blastocatellia bacterium]
MSAISNTSKKISVALILTAFVLASTFMPSMARVSAQTKQKGQEQKQEQKKDDQEITLEAQLVQLDVDVIDHNNMPVTNLKPGQFQVFEDKISQTIKSVSREEVPVSVGLVIDTSGSMRRKLPQVIDAAVNLVKQSRPHDEYFVVDFKDPESINLVEDYTTNLNDVIDALKDMIASGGTALFDALSVSAEHAKKGGKNRRKALVVITDGVEKDSFYKKDEVLEKLRECDVQLYMVGFTNDLDKESGLFHRSEKTAAEKLLKDVADDTGGRAFFPTELNQMKDISDEIARDLRQQYVITYIPSNTKHDGTFRRVQVKVNDNRNLVARTKTGYYATNDASTTPRK